MKLFSQKSLKVEHSKTIAVILNNTKNTPVPDEIKSILSDIDLRQFNGRFKETLFVPLANHPNLIICGSGKNENITAERLRIIGANITDICLSKNIAELHLVIPDIENFDKESIITSLSEGICLKNYSFNKYKTIDKKKKKFEKLHIYSQVPKAGEILKSVEIICRNTLECRDLVNETSDECNSDYLIKLAKQFTKLRGVTLKSLTPGEIKKLKMELLIAVNRGSKRPPAFIILKYRGNIKSKKFAAIVGKGITFDSGGLNLKGTGHMETMRMDMAGAATTLFTLKCAAELKLKKNLYAIVPTTDNMLTNDAYRPGDVFSSFSGQTVEIGNTDAEGRLILADALAYAETKLKPEIMIDLATLTGACVATFGELYAGLLSNNDELKNNLLMASKKTGDLVWELPLDEQYEDQIKSDIADMNNINSDKKAGTIIGGIFLKQFIKKTKWAHLDIAGTAWLSKPNGYRTKYATGFGVRLLIELLKNWND